MRLRTAAVTAMVAVAAAGTLSPAVAGPKPKPVSKEYTATAPTPDPVNPLVDGNCQPSLPESFHEEPFVVPFPGKLVVDLTGFQGDWALGVFTPDGAELASHDQQVGEPLDAPSQVTLKLKKKGQKLVIRACNFAGGPTANVKYVHTAS